MKRHNSRLAGRLRRRGVGAVAAAVALALAGCAGQSSDGDAAPSRAAAPPAAGQKPNRETAPDFELVAYQGEAVLGGKELAFSRVLEQGKPVVLNFWAGLCPPCRLEMPEMQEVYAEYQDRILLLGVDIGPFAGLGSREAGQALLRELKITYPAGTTFDAGVPQAYKLIGMPLTVFITPDGTIVKRWTGLLTKAKLIELVQQLLAASGK